MRAVSTFNNGSFNSGVFQVKYEEHSGLYFWHLIQVIESTSTYPPPAVMTMRAKQYAERNKVPFIPGLWDGSTEGLDPITLLSMAQDPLEED